MIDFTNALFYTFSTIAQTLAGAIALLGAFVLYRIQNLSSELEDASLGAIQPWSGDEKFHLLHVEGKYDELLQLLNARRPKEARGPGTRLGLVKQDKLQHLLERKREILRLLKFCLALTVSLIVVSIVVLAATPHIARSPVAVVVVLTVAIAWFAACFGAYGRLISRALE